MSGASTPSSGISVRVGTAADLIAQGPAPPCAACTLARSEQQQESKKGASGLFFNKGWNVFCSTHTNVAANGAVAQSVVAVPPIPARVQRPINSNSARTPPPVMSISARWKQQTMKKEQLKKKQQRQQQRIEKKKREHVRRTDLTTDVD